jgi:hypothetical protein
MGIFNDGSNRQRIHDLLSDKPITVTELSQVTGIEENAVKSVLQQICHTGHSKKKKTPEGQKGWVAGNGKLIANSKKTINTGENGPTAKIKQYLKDNIGNEFTIAQMKESLNIEKHAASYKIISDYEKLGHLTQVRTDRPYSWRVNPSINDPKQTALVPQASLPPPQHTLMPGTAPMDTSDAIAALMQTEHQNMINQQGLTQILAVYNQLGDILERMGLLLEE